LTEKDISLLEKQDIVLLNKENSHKQIQRVSIGFCRAQARKNPRSDGVFLELFGYFFFQEKK